MFRLFLLTVLLLAVVVISDVQSNDNQQDAVEKRGQKTLADLEMVTKELNASLNILKEK